MLAAPAQYLLPLVWQIDHRRWNPDSLALAAVEEALGAAVVASAWKELSTPGRNSSRPKKAYMNLPGCPLPAPRTSAGAVPRSYAEPALVVAAEIEERSNLN